MMPKNMILKNNMNNNDTYFPLLVLGGTYFSCNISLEIPSESDYFHKAPRGLFSHKESHLNSIHSINKGITSIASVDC
jgi:hypothetical protein